MTQTKHDRMLIVNNLITYISERGRQFFYSKESVTGSNVTAYMMFKNNRIYFLDNYSEKEIYVYNQDHEWDGFSHGGTIKALICEFRDFIRFGGNTNGTHGYSGLYCKHWGYDNTSMNDIVNYAKSIGYLN